MIDQEQKLIYGLKANTYVFSDWLTAALTSPKGCTFEELEEMTTACGPVRYTAVNPLVATLKPQSNGPLYSNTMTDTLAVDGWALIFWFSDEGPTQPTHQRPLCQLHIIIGCSIIVSEF